MSLIRKSGKKSWSHRLMIRVLRTGPIPCHVAFIMDGNRRYAKKNSMDRAHGHLMGFEKLAETLEWCLELGITEVTVYAFSIENFKRSKAEVDCLMELAREKFERLMQEKEMLEKHGVCIRVLGNFSLLPSDIQVIIAEAVTLTKHNNKAFLNVCFAYTSRDEMCTAMRDVAEGVRDGFIRESDISEDLLEKCLFTNKSPDPDLLVRTSGEVRLSDFLLWQSAYSVLSFMEVLWPDFSPWHLYGGILHYQRSYAAVQEAKRDNEIEKERRQRLADYSCVTAIMAKEKSAQSDSKDWSLQEQLRLYAQEREARIQTFLNHLENTRERFYQSRCKKTKALDETCHTEATVTY